MSDFWFWFTRPLAEFAGVLTLLAGVLLLMVSTFGVAVAYHWVRRKLGGE